MLVLDLTLKVGDFEHAHVTTCGSLVSIFMVCSLVHILLCYSSRSCLMVEYTISLARFLPIPNLLVSHETVKLHALVRGF